MLYNPNWKQITTPILDEVGQIMQLAADQFESGELEWGQGDYILFNGAVCLMGALHKMEKGRVISKDHYINEEFNCPITSKAVARIEAYFNKNRKSYNYVFVDSWNDALGRTKEEVIDVLRKASVYKANGV